MKKETTFLEDRKEGSPLRMAGDVAVHKDDSVRRLTAHRMDDDFNVDWFMQDDDTLVKEAKREIRDNDRSSDSNDELDMGDNDDEYYYVETKTGEAAETPTQSNTGELQHFESLTLTEVQERATNTGKETLEVEQSSVYRQLLLWSIMGINITFVCVMIRRKFYKRSRRVSSKIEHHILVEGGSRKKQPVVERV
jgi:hypothetical protein